MAYDLAYNNDSKPVFFQMLDLFPIPIEVFRPDGVSTYVNSAFLDCFHIPNPDMIVGKFNALQDTFILENAALAQHIKNAFLGEYKILKDIRVPFSEMMRRYYPYIDIPESDDLYQDIYSFPIKDEYGNLQYIVTIFVTKHIYKEKIEIAKAKDYIRTNWRDEFNMDRIAEVTGYSRDHFARIFKKYTGKTPYGYYQDIVIGELKNAINNKDYSLSRAFLTCGIEYNESNIRMFKERVGISPSRYRFIISNNELYEEAKEKIRVSRANYSYFLTNKAMIKYLFNIFSLPLIVFDVNGKVFHANKMIKDILNLTMSEENMSKINIKKDKGFRDRLGSYKCIYGAFDGELSYESNIILIGMETNNEIKSVFADVLSFPLIEEKEIHYIVSFFFIDKSYKGKSKILKAIEIIESQWKDNLKIEEVAKQCGYSKYHFTRAFKEQTGITPYNYYQDLKISKLKETLRDKNTTVLEAFDKCGISYHGDWASLFKEKVGMTPSEYRKNL